VLRAAFPSAHISLIGLPWAHQFVARFRHYLDELIEFPGYPGLPERALTMEAVPAFLTQMQARRFDLVLQMHGNGHYVNECSVLLGARMTGGFYVPGEYCPDNDFFIPYPDSLPEAHRHLKLMEFLGLPSLGDELEWPITSADEEAFRSLEESGSLMEHDYVCLHPGGRGVMRRQPPEQFGRLADLMTERGFQVVITGTKEEADLSAAMVRAMRTRAINLVGRTDLGALGVLLRHARMLIANDTGVSHVAAGLRVPSVILCTGSDPVRWGPLDGQRHRVLVGPSMTTESIIAEIDDVLKAERLEAEVQR
jgi:ADP-heptose:LPS heptosyltransferase